LGLAAKGGEWSELRVLRVDDSRRFRDPQLTFCSDDSAPAIGHNQPFEHGAEISRNRTCEFASVRAKIPD
ncbi:MAG TPA: hypothetical protein VGG82_07205, partial [Casimicrobiaceae bacterium]